MDYLVHPQDLVFRAQSRIEGFKKMVSDENIPQWELLEMATEVSEQWTCEWPEGQGFGSSDGTFMLKEFIDNVIDGYTRHGKYMTDFTPSLSVVPYSEADHHEKIQRMESGE
tara:strand:+ start:95 stop:430 length:336 start_codon:yes stop_codon:yes gene_type:complete